MFIQRIKEKTLQTGDVITLKNIIAEANALEAVSRQMEEFANKNKSTSQSVNKIESGSNKKKRVDKKTGCGRCRNPKHTSQDCTCSAKEKECLKCGLKGHFRQYCRTRQPVKRKQEAENKRRTDQKKFRPNKKADTVSQVSETGEVDYVFHIDDDVIVECKTGGVKVDILIDSGCKYNLITGDTWESMKNTQIKIYNQEKNPSKTFLTYGSNTPLKLKGSFEANLQVGGKSKSVTFYVVSNGPRNLLGNITAMSLGILKIGVDVNKIEERAFPKLPAKGYSDING